MYLFYALRSLVVSKSSLFPKVEQFVNGVFAPPVPQYFGVPAGAGGRALSQPDRGFVSADNKIAADQVGACSR